MPFNKKSLISSCQHLKNRSKGTPLGNQNLLLIRGYLLTWCCLNYSIACWYAIISLILSITYRSVPSVTAAVASAGGGSGMGGCASTGNGTNADREPYTSRTSLNHEIAMAGNSSNSRPQSRSHSHHCHAQQGCDYPSGWPQCSKKQCLKKPPNNNCAIHPSLGFKTCKKMCGADVVTLSYHDVDSSFDWNSESDDSYIWNLNQTEYFKKILDLCCIGLL